jgi:DNA-binding GntR family transcriptional regulator
MVKPEKRRLRGVQDVVYSALRSSIINLNLIPGTSISEAEVSQKFQVSRTPVREAFIHLSKEGLVEVIPQKETLVSLIDPARVEQEFFLRESLETAVLELFLLGDDRGRYFIEMETLIALQSSALKNKSYIDFINYDDQFHQILFEAAGQHLSWEVLASMSGHYHRIRMLTIRMEGIADERVGEHRKILTALKKGDSIKAKKMLYLHLHNLDTEKKSLKKKNPDYFVSGQTKTVFDVDFGGFPHFPGQTTAESRQPPKKKNTKKRIFI